MYSALALWVRGALLDTGRCPATANTALLETLKIALYLVLAALYRLMKMIQMWGLVRANFSPATNTESESISETTELTSDSGESSTGSYSVSESSSLKYAATGRHWLGRKIESY